MADDCKKKNKKLSFDKLKDLKVELNYYMNSFKNNLIINENIINYIVQPIKDTNYL
jgi:NADPH-dependent 7-cyano-7-deazaguanine reductase QueF